MFIALSSAAPVLHEPGRFDQFHVTVEGSLDDVDLGDLCRAEDDHVWVDIAHLRERVIAADPATADDFDRMIAYAASKGWVDPAGTAVRAHVQR